MGLASFVGSLRAKWFGLCYLCWFPLSTCTDSPGASSHRQTSRHEASHSTVPDVPERVHVAFSSEVAPIREVTIFCENKAEITRNVNFSSPSKLGRHEVELTGLPNRRVVNGESVRVKGFGHCSILYVTFSDQSKEDTKPEPTEEEKQAKKADKEKQEAELKRLSDEQTVLAKELSRNGRMRELIDRYAEGVVTTKARENTYAVPPPGTSDVTGHRTHEVEEALSWWADKAAKTDAEAQRLEIEKQGLESAIRKLRDGPDAPTEKAKESFNEWGGRGYDNYVPGEVPKIAPPGDRTTRSPTSLASLPRVQLNSPGGCSNMSPGGAIFVPSPPQTGATLLHPRPHQSSNPSKGRKKTDKTGRVIISIDVHELGPIEMEVKYMVCGATWSPEYDLRVDTLTDSVSCTYFGRVMQTTTEDWEGVALRLSTAEPSVRGTPPALGNKTVSFKVDKPPDTLNRMRAQRTAAAQSPQRRSFTQYSASFGTPASAPQLPPGADFSVARVEGSKGTLGVVSFAISLPAIIKSNGQTKKLTVGEFQLSAEVNHYVVPSKEPVAYLQAKATNDTEYELLPSNDVSIFFDNSFVAKTSLTSVSPGESFQAFLGIDPAVKITVAPPRKTSSKRGLFSKSSHVTHKHSTSIYNKKKVPVTCVVLEAMPLSTDETIKVTLNQPPPASVSDSEAINDEVLVSAVLEIFVVEDEGKDSDSSRSSRSTNLARLVKSGVAGVAKSPSNHLAWVGKIPPQSEIKIPLEYNVEWPTAKEIEVVG